MYFHRQEHGVPWLTVTAVCDPKSTGRYPDPDQPDLQFFKPNTHVDPPGPHDELRRSEPYNEIYYDTRPPPELVNGVEKSVYDSILWRSVNPRAAALHKLDKRAPAPPDW